MILIFSFNSIFSVTATVDSLTLKQAVENARTDSAKILAIGVLARYYATFNNQRAIDHYNQAIKICDNNSAKHATEFYIIEKASLQASLGVTYYMIANYPRAIKAELEAIKVFEKYDVKEKLGRCYIVIGAIHSHQNQINKALEYQNKSLALSKEVNDSSGMALALNNIGISYFDQNNLVLAIKYYNESYEIYEKLQDKRGMGVELLNLGSVYKKRKELDNAIAYFQQSIVLRNEISDHQGLIFSHAQLGLCFFTKGDLQHALEQGIISLKYADEMNYTRGIRDANELLAKVYEKMGDYPKAFAHVTAFHAAKDSMNDAESISRVATSEAEFRFGQENLADSLESAARENTMKIALELQETKSEKQNQRIQFMVLSLIVIFIVAIFIIIQNRKTAKQKQIIAQQKLAVEQAFDSLKERDEEKELLLKEIHHRVKNNLQVISSLLELQAKKVNDSESEVFKEGQSRVRAMALIHEELYQNHNLASVDFYAYTSRLTSQIRSLFTEKRMVSIEISGPRLQLDIDTAIPLGLILNELITNAFKYGLQPNGTLHVAFSQDPDGKYSVAVKDNGAGMPAGFELKNTKSLGLRLVNRLSKQLYGDASFCNDKGAAFNINFKDAQQRKEVA